MAKHHVELVDETGTVDVAELTAVAAALQVQVDRDLSDQWHVHATVAARAPGAEAKPHVWPVRITTDVEPGALGVHLDDTGTPYAVIRPGDGWSVTASHELLEMLVDPHGSRLHTAPSIDPSAGGRLVHYLVEVADPVETVVYDVDGISVSDFITQDFYHRHKLSGDQYDQQSRLTDPLEVLAGGYLSWYDDYDRRWHQKRPDGTFVTARAVADLSTDFRDSRDRSFAEDEPERHDLPTLLTRHAAR